MKKYKGLFIPRKKELDYENARVVHCNSCDSEFCDGVDCDGCLFGEKNIKKFIAWLKEGKIKFKACERACKEYDIDYRDHLED